MIKFIEFWFSFFFYSATWVSTDTYTDCSVTCGDGEQTEIYQCSTRNESDCDEATRPFKTQNCSMLECRNIWFFLRHRDLFFSFTWKCHLIDKSAINMRHERLIRVVTKYIWFQNTPWHTGLWWMIEVDEATDR